MRVRRTGWSLASAALVAGLSGCPESEGGGGAATDAAVARDAVPADAGQVSDTSSRDGSSPDATPEGDGSAASMDSSDSSAPDTNPPTDSGQPDTSPPIFLDASTCVMSLANTSDFTASFTITTTYSSFSNSLSILSQGCVNTSGWVFNLQPSEFGLGGFVAALVGNGATAQSKGPVNDGLPHHIVIVHTGDQLSIQVDGVVGMSVLNQSVFGALPALSVGTSCLADSTSFVGTLSDVCITSP